MKRCDTKSVIVKASSAFLPLALLGCSSLPLSPGAAIAQSAGTTAEGQQSSGQRADAGQSGMDSQLMYELLVAELAGRRGQLDVALAGYLRAAERTNDPRVSERAVRLALFARQWGEAEAMATRWQALEPDNNEAARLLGQALLNQNKSEAAATNFVQLVANTHADSRRQVLRDIQIELQRNDDPAVAVSIMQALVDNHGDQTEAYLGLARAQITNGDTDAALLTAQAALSSEPDDTDALLLNAQILGGVGKPDQAFALLQDALNNSPENTELRLGYAQLLVEVGRYDSVEAELAKVFAESRNNPDNLLTIGLLAIESRRLELASGYFEALRNTGEYSDQANFYLASISDDQREYEQAIELYDAVIEGDLRFNAQLRAAELTALIGNLDGGRSRLQSLASSVPNPAVQPRLVTAESRMLQNANQIDEAVGVLSDGLERFPDDESLLYARALAANAAGNDDDMIADLTRLIELDPNNAHALNALGYHYADKNIELVKAEGLLVKANELLPEDPAIMDSLGWLRFRQARYNEAIELLRDAYQRFPDPEIASHLVEALWMSGAQGEARELIKQALEKSPEDERLLALQKNVIK